MLDAQNKSHRIVGTLLTILILSLFYPGVVSADFVNPASLEITEIQASEFEAVLTLPLIKGRVLKAKPVFPECFVMQGEVTERAVSGSVLRTWSMTCAPQDLVDAAIGVQGLPYGCILQRCNLIESAFSLHDLMVSHMSQTTS